MCIVNTLQAVAELLVSLLRSAITEQLVLRLLCFAIIKSLALSPAAAIRLLARAKAEQLLVLLRSAVTEPLVLSSSFAVIGLLACI